MKEKIFIRILISLIAGLIVLFIEYEYLIPGFDLQSILSKFNETKQQLTTLRSTPAIIMENDAQSMLVEKGFYSSYWNQHGAGLPNYYEVLAGGKVILDRSSGLMWQQSGTPETMTYEEAEKYIAQLNRDKYAGYKYWRLPTLDEAMSLTKPVKYTSLFIAPDFDENQIYIWTVDRKSAAEAWSVDFNIGDCYASRRDAQFFVRAVRIADNP